MSEARKISVTWHDIDDESAGQRIDNYLIRLLKGVPKTHVYRILRGGEVRINSRRADPAYRLQSGDRVRVPPLRVAQRADAPPAGRRGTAPAVSLARHIIYEDDTLLVLDKPAGIAVHGGSGIARGVIEQLRAERPDARFLELVHRLDRDTSGVLLIAKRRSALTDLHRQLRDGLTHKYYRALVVGRWRDARRNVRLPLRKYVTADGERRVSVAADGMPSHTLFTLEQAWDHFTLLNAELKTGRTHQIRVHLAHLGFPIAGDEKYGDFPLNRQLARCGLKRMFLHAARLVCSHPRSGERLELEAPLAPKLAQFVARLDRAEIDIAEVAARV
jgi:23S rRNA pseudouridine955/2504/2580 synthase